jgi:S-formylglutathione hydrolase
MTFGLYLPPAAEEGPVPLLWFLSGLTCTHENAMVKAGAQGWAAKAGIAVVFPDTSPRGEGVRGSCRSRPGPGRGVLRERGRGALGAALPHVGLCDGGFARVLFNAFPLDEERQAITGHSMGGHGALTMAMRFPGRFASVSALAPIAHPVASDWGRKQFTAYLGPDRGLWAGHDATLLMREWVSGRGAGGSGGE